MKASTYGVLNLQRMLKELPEWTYEGNDIQNETMGSVYNQVYSQFLRYCYHVLANIGSIYANFKTVNEPGDIYVDEPREKQMAALDWLDKNVLQEPTWLVDQPYMRRITPNPESFSKRNLAQRVCVNMVSRTVLGRLTSTYPVEQYLPDVVGRIFKEATTRTTPSAYRKTIQREVVNQLISHFKGGNQYDYYPIVLQQLRRLQRLCHTASSDPHFAALADQIDRALVIK